MKPLCWHISDGRFWFRIFGYGFGITDRSKHGALFSERHWLVKVLRLGKWVVKGVKP